MAKINVDRIDMFAKRFIGIMQIVNVIFVKSLEMCFWYFFLRKLYSRIENFVLILFDFSID